MLHEVAITVGPEYEGMLRCDQDVRVPGEFTFDGTTLASAGVRLKGSGGCEDLSGKPGFSIKFDEFVAGQELHDLEKLLLNSAVQDPTFLSEHLAYEILRRAGRPAHRTAHAVVTFNDEPYGLYVLSEPYNKQFLRRNFGAANDEGNLYEGPPEFVDFVLDPAGMELKNEVEEMRSREDLEALAEFIVTSADADLLAGLADRMDVDAFVTNYAVEAILYHWDGYMYGECNYYLYHNPGDDRFVYIGHGMDQVGEDIWWDANAWPTGTLAVRLREIPELDAAFQDAVRDILMGDVWDVKALGARIDQAEETLNAYTPGDGRTASDIASFNAWVGSWRDYLVARRDFVLGTGP